eukprot:4722480-Amphidinium_carterae.1
MEVGIDSGCITSDHLPVYTTMCFEPPRRMQMGRYLRVHDADAATIVVAPLPFHDTLESYQQYLCNVSLPNRSAVRSEHLEVLELLRLRRSCTDVVARATLTKRIWRIRRQLARRARRALLEQEMIRGKAHKCKTKPITSKLRLGGTWTSFTAAAPQLLAWWRSCWCAVASTEVPLAVSHWSPWDGDDLRQASLQLRASAACGVDGASTDMFQWYGHEDWAALADLMNDLAAGRATFPSQWKCIPVVLLPKKAAH